MLHLPFVSAIASAVAGVIGGSSPSAILCMLGSLLFVFGTALRRNLPAVDGASSSYPCTLRVDWLPLHTDFGTVNGVANTAASQRHANAA